MTERIYETPSLNGVLDQYLFLQNLPSMIVSHVLDVIYSIYATDNI
jgi:hypothetical protein